MHTPYIKVKERAKTTIQNALIIVIIATTSGIIFNFPLIRNFLSNRVEIIHKENFSEISLVEAKNLFDKGEGFFIDARSTTEYKEGHIKGAINIPVGRIFQYLEKNISKLPKDKILVSYCSGSHCESSFELAEILKQSGFDRVKTFFNGWVEWVKAGYPVE
jgi:rhodanese-related sulfurtransferase